MTDASPPLIVDASRWLVDLGLERLPPEVVADVRLRVLDTLGVALAAVETPIANAVREVALTLGDGSEARLLGTGERVPASSAALVNGTLAHVLDFDDTHNETVLHVSAVSVTTALVLGEALGRSGAEVLVAVAGGSELACRLALIAPGAFHRQGLHPTGLFGALSAALIAAKMMGLDVRRTAAAAGIAGSQSAGILESLSDGSAVKTLHPGWAAHAGIIAARLAAAGFTGPATVVEGRFGLFRSHVPTVSLAWERLLDALGTRWEMLATSFKPYPCAHVIHPYVDAMRALTEAHSIDSDAIASIEATVSAFAHPIVCEPRELKLNPATPTHARASLPYAIAASVVRGGLDTSAYTNEAIAEPRIRQLAERITFRVDDTPQPRDSFRGALQVRLNNGREHSHVEAANRGSCANPMSPTELDDKFRHCAGDVLAAQQIDAVIAAARELEDLRSVSAMLDHCIRSN